MSPFHDRYGVPARFPEPLEITPAIRATMANLSPSDAAEYLVLVARRDFQERFPVLGVANSLVDASDRAWAAHCQSYLMHVFGLWMAGQSEARRAA